MATGSGLNWLIYLDVSESETAPSWVKLANQRTGSSEFGKSDVDATTKDNSGWEDSLTVRRNWSIECEGLVDEADPAVIYLVGTHLKSQASQTDNKVHVKLVSAAGKEYAGWATLESFSWDFAESELVTYSASFKGRGALTQNLA